MAPPPIERKHPGNTVATTSPSRRKRPPAPAPPAASPPRWRWYALVAALAAACYANALDGELFLVVHLMVAGRDPQLERAIDYVMDQLKAHPVKRPERPKYKRQQ